MLYQYLNEQDLKANFNGDEDILSELITEFLLRINDMINELDGILIDQDFSKLELKAHTLKGVISNFYAIKIWDQCYLLEKDGATKNLKMALTHFEELKLMLTEFIEELKKFQAGMI